MKTIKVKLKRNPYEIHIGKDALANLPCLIKRNKIGQDAIIITTQKILSLHGEKIKKALKKSCHSALILTVADSEKSKNSKTAFELIEKITKFDKYKKIFLVAFGGGVIGDLTGFVAAIYKRGIPYIQIPTTLLAQIDSSIGGKTAIDTTSGKNLIGAFYQPSLVLADTNLLKTLPKNQILAGLSEAIKYATIKDPVLFLFLEKNYQKILKCNFTALSYLIQRCASIKAKIVAQDEFDKKGIRVILNFGHTIGHAVETASNFKISHGEAVSIGMACACKISEKLKLLRNNATCRIINLIKKIGLPSKIKITKQEDIFKSMCHDKKWTEGKNKFVLLEKIGKTKIVEDIEMALIKKVVAELSAS